MTAIYVIGIFAVGVISLSLYWIIGWRKDFSIWSMPPASIKMDFRYNCLEVDECIHPHRHVIEGYRNYEPEGDVRS